MMIACKCGCELMINNPDNRGRYIKYIFGHGRRLNRNIPLIKYRKMYKSWSGIKQRCLNPKNNKYNIYGGRGIDVCNKWLTFDGFYEDMQSSWKEGLSIDRIDNNKGYFKVNCRWATLETQANNKRRNRYITYKGITKSVSQWAHDLDIKQSTLSMRLLKYGWSIQRALESRGGGSQF